MAANDKDTIYIDIDDEITGIIDKLKASNGKVVALVLPKRAAVFQSIVNMKLLKRAADSSQKHMVLITSEAGLLPLAGAAGVHVAKTLTSKPEIPLGPDMGDDIGDEEVQEDLGAEDVPPDPAAPVGQLAGGTAAAMADDVETVVLDDEDLPPEADDAKPVPKTFAPPKGKKNKLAVPNFERFRLLLIAGGLALILLIVGLILAISVLPKATIMIKTDATTVDTNIPLNLSTTAKTLEEDGNIIPAKLSQTQKTYTQQVPTTGQKNNGNKASGSVAITNCSKTEGEVTIPAGTGLSSGGNTYISQESVKLPESTFNGAGKCTTASKPSVDILAQSGGSSYNLPNGASFTVAGYPGLTGSGGTAGGTDSIVQTVNQNDINAAKAKIVPNDAEMKKILNEQLVKDKLYPIAATYTAGTPATTSSANVGDVANNVTVTEVVTYTMFGVKKSDLEKLQENAIKEQIDEEKQGILDNGIGKANYNVDEISATAAKLTMSTVALAGPDLDIDAIKREAAGQKPGAIKADLGNRPGVQSVEVKLSPFWVSSVPKKTEKIKVEIAKPAAKASSTSAGDN